MGDDGAPRLLPGQRPGGCCDTGGAADQHRGGVTAEAKGLDLTHHRAEAGVRPLAAIVTAAAVVASRQPDKEITHRDEGVDGRLGLLILQTCQVRDETGDYGDASAHHGTNSGHGVV